jgi:hypothetical protein
VEAARGVSYVNWKGTASMCIVISHVQSMLYLKYGFSAITLSFFMYEFINTLKII